MKKTILITLVIVSFIIGPLVFSQSSQTQRVLTTGGSSELQTQDTAFIAAAGLGTASPAIIISLIIKVLLGFLGIIFIVLLIYAGFKWLTSAGNEEQISAAKKTIVTAIIGLTIVLAAYIITVFVLDKIIEATTSRSFNTLTL